MFGKNMRDSDLADLLRWQQQQANPLNSFASKPEPAPTKTDWERATVYGFVGHVSVVGWRAQVQQRSGRFDITWDSRGRQLHCEITGDDKRRAFVHACAMLAGWEPSLKHWLGGFHEIGVKP